MDTTPDYRYSIRPKEVIARFMTGYCELCCKNELPVMIYQVKNLKKSFRQRALGTIYVEKSAARR